METLIIMYALQCMSNKYIQKCYTNYIHPDLRKSLRYAKKFHG